MLPEERGHGVAGALLAAGIRWARDAGSPAVRLSTSSGNPASNRLAERDGFAITERFRPLRASAADRPSTAHLAQPADFPAIWDAVREVAFYTEGWTAYRLTPPRLALLLSQHAVVVAGNAVLIATATRRWAGPRIGLAAGGSGDIAEAARLIRARTAALGLPDLRATIADRAEVIAALEDEGFTGGEGWEDAMLLHELQLDTASSPRRSAGGV